jgi:hypothetical protein
VSDAIFSLYRASLFLSALTIEAAFESAADTVASVVAAAEAEAEGEAKAAVASSVRPRFILQDSPARLTTLAQWPEFRRPRVCPRAGVGGGWLAVGGGLASAATESVEHAAAPVAAPVGAPCCRCPCGGFYFGQKAIVGKQSDTSNRKQSYP